MFIDSVLRNQQGSPIPQGISLYRILKEKGRVLILCNNKARDERWLRENKINLLDDLIDPDLPSVTEDPSWRQVEFCRGQWQIEMVVTADPELSAKLLNAGITTLMFLHPLYITEKFRPDSRQGVKPWKDIVNEISYQQESIVDDSRIQ
jgi:hypothetical protein